MATNSKLSENIFLCRKLLSGARIIQIIREINLLKKNHTKLQIAFLRSLELWQILHTSYGSNKRLVCPKNHEQKGAVQVEGIYKDQLVPTALNASGLKLKAHY